MGRKQTRETTMHLVYQLDITRDFSKGSMEVFLDNFGYDLLERQYIIDAYEKIVDNLEEIDKKIESNLQGWDIKRLAKVDLAILRIALYEIIFREDIPIEVSINEAIEMAKKYSNEDAFKFINGVLGGIVRSIENEVK